MKKLSNVVLSISLLLCSGAAFATGDYFPDLITKNKNASSMYDLSTYSFTEGKSFGDRSFVDVFTLNTGTVHSPINRPATGGVGGYGLGIAGADSSGPGSSQTYNTLDLSILGSIKTNSGPHSSETHLNVHQAGEGFANGLGDYTEAFSNIIIESDVEQPIGGKPKGYQLFDGIAGAVGWSHDDHGGGSHANAQAGLTSKGTAGGGSSVTRPAPKH